MGYLLFYYDLKVSHVWPAIPHHNHVIIIVVDDVIVCWIILKQISIDTTLNFYLFTFLGRTNTFSREATQLKFVLSLFLKESTQKGKNLLQIFSFRLNLLVEGIYDARQKVTKVFSFVKNSKKPTRALTLHMQLRCQAHF